MTGIETIAQERARQQEKEGWTPQHDAQHAGHELLMAAEYYCAYDVFADMNCDMSEYKDCIDLRFPSSWSERWKKRQGFPVPTDRDLAKAGALIAAELDRRAHERTKNGTGPAKSIVCPLCKSTAVLMEHRFRAAAPVDTGECLDCGHVWVPGSQYGPATEEPEDAPSPMTPAECVEQIRAICVLPDATLEDLPGLIEDILSELAARQIRADVEGGAA